MISALRSSSMKWGLATRAVNPDNPKSYPFGLLCFGVRGFAISPTRRLKRLTRVPQSPDCFEGIIADRAMDRVGSSVPLTVTLDTTSAHSERGTTLIHKSRHR